MGRWGRLAGLCMMAGAVMGAAPAAPPVPPPLILKCSFTGEIWRSGTDRQPSLIQRIDGVRYYRMSFKRGWDETKFEPDTQSVWYADPGEWRDEHCYNQGCDVRPTRIAYNYRYMSKYVFDDNTPQRPSLQSGGYSIDRVTGAYRFEQKEEAAKPFPEIRVSAPLSDRERAPDGAVVTETRTGSCEKSAGPGQDVKF